MQQRSGSERESIAQPRSRRALAHEPDNGLFDETVPTNTGLRLRERKQRDLVVAAPGPSPSHSALAHREQWIYPIGRGIWWLFHSILAFIAWIFQSSPEPAVPGVERDATQANSASESEPGSGSEAEEDDAFYDSRTLKPAKLRRRLERNDPKHMVAMLSAYNTLSTQVGVFDGFKPTSSIEEYINRFEQWAKPEIFPSRTLAFAHLASESALALLDSMADLNPSGNPRGAVGWRTWEWPKLKGYLLDIFHKPVDVMAALDAFRHQRQQPGVTVREHMQTMMKLALKAGQRDSNAAFVTAVVRGSFSSDLQQFFKHSPPEGYTWRALLDAAVQAETDAMLYNRAKEEERGTGMSSFAVQAVSFRGSHEPRQPSQGAGFTCYNCGKQGHKAAQCRSKKKGDHKKQFTSGRQVFFTRGIAGLGGRSMDIAAMVNGRPLPCTIDTGSDISMIRADILDPSDGRVEPFGGKVIDAFGNQYDGIKGTIKMQLNLGKGPQPVTFFVASQLSKPILIGDDTLAQLNVVAHPAARKAVVDGLTIECTHSQYNRRGGSYSSRIAESSGGDVVFVRAFSEHREHRAPAFRGRADGERAEKESKPTVKRQAHHTTRLAQGTPAATVPSQETPRSALPDSTQGNQDQSSIALTSERAEALLRVIAPSLRHRVSAQDFDRACALIRKCASAFALDDDPHTIARVPPVRLYVWPGRPIQLRSRRLYGKERSAAEDIITKGLRDGIFKVATGEYAATGRLVEKKNGTYRLVCNYIPLNTRIDKIPVEVPAVRDLLANIGQFKYISTADLASMFWQFPLAEESMPYTGFKLNGRHLMYTCLPMGLVNSSGHTQRYLQELLHHVKRLQVYSDDLTLASNTFDEHLSSLEAMLTALMGVGLKLKASKCSFFAEQATVLGHLITSDGYAPTMERMEDIRKLASPTSKSELKTALALLSYDGAFCIKNFSLRCAPLYNLTKDDAIWDWTAEAERMFRQLCAEFAIGSCQLAFPLDGGPYRVTSDASDVGLGASLEQLQSGKWRVIEFLSRRWSGPESRYSTTDRELLAAVSAVSRWRHFLRDDEFILRSDHKPLLGIDPWAGNRQADDRRARWCEELSGLKFRWEYVEGSSNLLADMLSRYGHSHEYRSVGTQYSLEDLTTNTNASMQCFTVASANVDPSGAWELSMDEIIQAQRGDPLCQEIVKALTNPGSTSYPTDARSWPGMAFLMDDVICLHTGRGYTVETRVFIPSPLREKLLAQGHSTPLRAHLSATKMMASLGQSFFWPRMYDDITKHVGSCHTCLAVKRGQGTTTPTGTLTGRSFNDLVAMDLMGPYPQDHYGYRYILTMVDAFTKRVSVAPLVSTAAEELCRGILRYWVSEHGVPTRILSDNGSNFTGKLLQDVLELFRAKHIFSRPYHPQGNGLVERTNQTVKTYLTAIMRDATFSAWSDALPSVQRTINTTVATATGITPEMASMGTATDTFVNLIQKRDKGAHTDVSAVAAELVRSKEILHAMLEHQVDLAEANAREANDVATPTPINIGETVMVKIPKQQQSFLGDRYKGPYTVSGKIGDHQVMLVPKQGGTETVAPVAWLKKSPRDLTESQLPKNTQETTQQGDDTSNATDLSEAGRVSRANQPAHEEIKRGVFDKGNPAINLPETSTVDQQLRRSSRRTVQDSPGRFANSAWV